MGHAIRLFGKFGVIALFIALVFPSVAATNEAKEGADETVLRRMIGQMIMVGFVGGDTEAAGYRVVEEQAVTGKITGVLYLGRNIRTREEVRSLSARLQRTAAEPLLIAVDQEGGRVQRLTRDIGFQNTPGAAVVARSMSPDYARSLYLNMARGLADLGFNLNLGPVVDLNVNPANPIIGRLGRSYGTNPNRVTAYAKAFIESHRTAGVFSALKHFPGHGSSVGDTHKDSVDVGKTWTEGELVPYRDLIASGDAEIVMTAHIINGALSDGKRIPATLSSAVLKGILRGELNFKGVIMSDDLQMEAIAGTMAFEDTVRQAVLSGNDILLFANDKRPDPTIPERAAAILVKASRSDPVMRGRIEESFFRIMKLKAQLVPAPFVTQEKGR